MSAQKSTPNIVRLRRILILAIAIIAVGVTAGVISHRDAARHAAYAYERAGDDTLNVAIAYSPMSLYRYGDTLGGFNYEMLREMARTDDFPVKFYPVVSVDEALERLRRGGYDVVVADIPMFASQREHYRFTVPVYTDRQVLVSRDSVPATPLALAGTDVWVTAGSPAIERLGNLSREIGDSIHVCVSRDYSAEQLVMLVADGQIPRAVVNQEVARRLLARYPDLRIADNISFSQFQSWILNADAKALQDTLDSRIVRFKETPAYQALLDKWTGDDTEATTASEAPEATPEM